MVTFYLRQTHIISKDCMYRMEWVLVNHTSLISYFPDFSYYSIH